MRRIFFLLAVLCFTVFVFSQNNIDVLHYKYEIYLSDNTDSITDSSQIWFKANKDLNEITFDLTSLNKNGKGMIVLKTISPLINKGLIEGKHENNKLTIKLPKTLHKNDTTFIGVAYTGIPADGLIISKTKFGHRSFFADNWPNRGHNWLPCHDDPADKATVEFIVTAPEHYQVVANGVQIEETSLGNNLKLTHWKEDTPISTKVMVIGAADFAVSLAGFVNGNIPIYSWVYPENKDKGFYDYAQAAEILPWFIKNVGPYGYKKLANVQSKTTFGGLENANTIFYSEGSVTGTRKSEGLIAHEIAHQWFGNMATEKSFGHLWLSEGFATYFTILYFENKYGKDTAIKMLREDRDQVISYSKRSNKAVVDTEEKDFMNLLNVNSYQKGGWVLHMLRSELGDSTFWRSIRKYYATYAGSVADTRDLQKVFEEISGKNLKQFFDQWLYTPGQPELDVIWTYDATGKFITVDIKQLQETAFSFPLSFKLDDKKEKIIVRDGIGSFKIKTDKKPKSLTADPDTELLMKATIKEK